MTRHEREVIRDFLGVSQLTTMVGVLMQLPHRLDRLEQMMASASEQLQQFQQQVTDMINNVRAEMDILKQEDRLSPEGQAALDRMTSQVRAFNAEVLGPDGQPGGGDSGQAPQTDQPPAEGGADGGDTGQDSLR